MQFEQSLAETKQLVDTALKEAQQKIQTGEQPAIEKLKAQGREIITPEQIGEGPRETTPSRIPTEEAPSTLKTAEQMLAQRVEPVFEEPVVQAPRESTPLRSIDDILAQHEMLHVRAWNEHALATRQSAHLAGVEKPLDLLIDAADWLEWLEFMGGAYRPRKSISLRRSDGFEKIEPTWLVLH